MGISVRDLVKVYGQSTVIKGISFDVADGEFVTLLGPSGCGKTTTLRGIAGLDTIDGGEIRINDQIVSNASSGVFVPPHERNLGMVFQSYAVWPHLTVAQNVAFPLTVRGVQDTTEAVQWALDIVGMNHLAARRPSELSGGQQQRVALARAIVGKPQVLLFDEPLSNLDARLRDRTRAEISRIQRELRVPAIYVTHDQTEALSMSDRIIVLNAGLTIQDGTPTQIYHEPVNRFVADFIGNANFLNIQRRGPTWTLPDGTPLLVTADAKHLNGEPVVALLRPETIRLEDHPPNQATPGLNRLTGTVVNSIFLGQHIEHLIRVAGTELRAFSREPREAGMAITLSFHASDCRVLIDNTNEQRTTHSPTPH
jgi:iron(III) transport system ATP-binding protein